MKITRKKNTLYTSKPEGLNVFYYVFPEYEVHYNEQLPGSTQTWHHHEKIWETLYIIEGELTAQWKEDEKIKTEIVKTGDLIETEDSPHTFTNKTNNIVKFVVIKQVLSNKDKRKILKEDKVLD